MFEHLTRDQLTWDELMVKTLDLTGQVFGRLTALSRIEKPGQSKWLCRCQCGNIKEVLAGHLKQKHTQSCGCLHKEVISAHFAKHKMKKTPEYNSWINMKQRCYNAKHPAFKSYGGRGIVVCDRWLDSFLSFYDDMGPKPGPGYSVDRINNDGNYEINNCRWATAKEQCRNMRTNTAVEYHGDKMCLAKAGEASGIPAYLLSQRVRAGWSNSDLFLPAGSART